MDFPDGKKAYFLDTSVLMHDPEVVERLSADGNVVVILIHVLAELDKSKKFHDQAGINSRTVSRLLDNYREIGMLSAGVATKSGGKVIVDHDGHNDYFDQKMAGLEKTVDNRIVMTALWWKENSGDKYEKIAIVTKDIYLRVKADAFGVDAEDYQRDKRIRKIDELYTGARKITLPLSDAKVSSDLPRKKVFSLDDLSPEGKKLFRGVFPNECIYLDIGEKRLLAIYKKKGRNEELVWVKRPSKEMQPEKGKVSPTNDEQAFQYALLTDPDISLVTITGGAGTGKTLIALLAGMDQSGESNSLYKAVKVFRPNIEVGNSLGFLPGDIDQKFAPWMDPILDNLSLIMRGGSYDEVCGKNGEISKSEAENVTIEMLMKTGLSIQPINYLRGRSLHDMYIMIDEAQNLTPHEVKMIVTRVGRRAKIVLTGDCTQIDNPYLDAVSNGLTHAVERLKGEGWAASIMLRVSERSIVANRAAELL